MQNDEGMTPLHIACACDHALLAQVLLRKGARPDLTDAHGKLPLDLASPGLAAKLAPLLPPPGSLQPLDEFLRSLEAADDAPVGRLGLPLPAGADIAQHSIG